MHNLHPWYRTHSFHNLISSSGNRTPDLLILSPTPYSFSHMGGVLNTIFRHYSLVIMWVPFIIQMLPYVILQLSVTSLNSCMRTHYKIGPYLQNQKNLKILGAVLSYPQQTINRSISHVTDVRRHGIQHSIICFMIQEKEALYMFSVSRPAECSLKLNK